MSETEGSPQLTGKMFLFERPELLSKDNHAGLGFDETDQRFRFCATARGIPITATEVPAAMKDYPIIVVNAEKPMLLAAVGLIDDINLFVDEDGNWEDNTYIPAYVRRYPFGVATEDKGDRFAVVVDRAFSGLVEGGQLPLFENDQPTENTVQAVDFCQRYERDRVVTQTFCDRLKELDLLQGQNANFTPEGESQPVPFAEYIGINEEKIKELSDEKYLELRNDGLAPVIYGMLMSLGNWPQLLQRRAKRFGLTGPDVLKPISAKAN